MSVLTAIFQAILQGIAWILPISESAHSSMYHDFAGSSTGACSVITGVVHISMAIGIVLASYKLFITLSKEFFDTASDIFKKNLRGSHKKPARSFMYMTLISFAPMLLWLIPIGKNGFLYSVLRKTGYNGTLLDDGVFLAVTGVLVLLTARQLSLSKNNKNVNLISAAAVGVCSVFLVPVSGLSLTAGIFAILMILGVSKKLAFRYTLVMSVPTLIVMGIIEICSAAVTANAVSIILGIILSLITSFFAVKIIKWLINQNKIKFFGIYDIAVGVIIFVIGIFEIALR